MPDFTSTATVTPTSVRVDLTKTGAPAGFVLTYSVVLPSGQTIARNLGSTLTATQVTTLTNFLTSFIQAAETAEGLSLTP